MKAIHGHPKLRIKIPKLWVVTKMQRKFHLHIKHNATASASANDTDKGNTRTKRGNGLPRKLVGSVLSGVLGNKRSLAKYPSKRKKNEPHGDGKQWYITGKASSRELGNNLVCGDEPVVAALSQLLTLEETTGTAAGEGKQNIEDKQPGKMSLPLLTFLDKKKKGWNNFVKARTRRIRFSSDVHGNGDDVVTTFAQVRRKASSCRFVRIPSKILVIRVKLKMIRSLMKKKVTKQFEEQDLGQEADENEDEDEDGELCKKRILMGLRCKPLSSSGTLRYDKDGLLLPEIVP